MSKLNGIYVWNGDDVADAIKAREVLGEAARDDLAWAIDGLIEEAEERGRDRGYDNGYESGRDSVTEYEYNAGQQDAIEAIENQIQRLTYGGLDATLSTVEILQRLVDDLEGQVRNA